MGIRLFVFSAKFFARLMYPSSQCIAFKKLSADDAQLRTRNDDVIRAVENATPSALTLRLSRGPKRFFFSRFVWVKGRHRERKNNTEWIFLARPNATRNMGTRLVSTHSFGVLLCVCSCAFVRLVRCHIVEPKHNCWKKTRHSHHATEHSNIRIHI